MKLGAPDKNVSITIESTEMEKWSQTGKMYE